MSRYLQIKSSEFYEGGRKGGFKGQFSNLAAFGTGAVAGGLGAVKFWLNPIKGVSDLVKTGKQIVKDPFGTGAIIKSQLTTNPTGFFGEIAGSVAVNYGVTKGAKAGASKVKGEVLKAKPGLGSQYVTLKEKAKLLVHNTKIKYLLNKKKYDKVMSDTSSYTLKGQKFKPALTESTAKGTNQLNLMGQKATPKQTLRAEISYTEDTKLASNIIQKGNKKLETLSVIDPSKTGNTIKYGFGIEGQKVLVKNVVQYKLAGQRIIAKDTLGRTLPTQISASKDVFVYDPGVKKFVEFVPGKYTLKTVPEYTGFKISQAYTDAPKVTYGSTQNVLVQPKPFKVNNRNTLSELYGKTTKVNSVTNMATGTGSKAATKVVNPGTTSQVFKGQAVNMAKVRTTGPSSTSITTTATTTKVSSTGLGVPIMNLNQRSGTVSKLQLRSIQNQQSRQVQEPMTRIKLNQVLEPVTRIKSGLDSDSSYIFKIKTSQRQTPVFRSSLKSDTVNVPLFIGGGGRSSASSSPPPPEVPKILPRLDLEGFKKVKKRKRGSALPQYALGGSYAPSLDAIVFNIKSRKTPKVVTGFEIRPIKI